MAADIENVKRELARLAAKKSARITRWSPNMPTQWQPMTVIDPRNGQPFTPSGAWEFIVEKLQDSDTVLEEKFLDKPKGKKAYVLRIDTENGQIYIKIHFGNGGKIVGRSFH